MSDRQSITEKLAELTDGLLWMSEADYPWNVVSWDKPTVSPAELIQAAGREPTASIQQKNPDDFFQRAVTEKEWQDASERERVRRYRELVHFLKNNLADLTVYRIGEVEIDTFVIGKTPSGTVAGIATTVVET
ncbi:nuclease A inhibitor family protein [Phormidium sp. CCY1219]|uniref:nuclease A inhibitor family protein n=1 Tax=Phormidium sp. CCY1219 TaxID=2886104 RepID=UPI002D1E782B|nr:nuclease A inhibitor family protein [Phormidium sp. CCY1219]MEB3827811.1 nuclease A inhibitor family protein [Phormidium sp. CCY1219]